MYINIQVSLTEEQLKTIQEQTKIEINNAFLEGKLTGLIKETIKSQIKSLVNEEIQTKNYRSHIAKKVQETLIKECLIENEVGLNENN